MSLSPGYTFTDEIYRGPRSVVSRAVRDEDAQAVVVKTPVEVHGGRVWIESPGRGQGSTFCFTLARRGPG